MTTAQAHRTAAKHHPRRIALFGGSFDPIHSGHLAVARAADRRFNFDEIHFIPASRPPHKLKQHLAPFPHRFAMVALACAEHPHFVPSLAEAGEDFSGTQLHYSIDTVRYFRHAYNGTGRPGIFHGWRGRVPGYSDVEGVRNAAGAVRFRDCQPAGNPAGGAAPGDSAGFARGCRTAKRDKREEDAVAHGSPVVARLQRTTVYLLENVASEASATDIRQQGQSRAIDSRACLRHAWRNTF